MHVFQETCEFVGSSLSMIETSICLPYADIKIHLVSCKPHQTVSNDLLVSVQGAPAG
jgi:hypothetical protein